MKNTSVNTNKALVEALVYNNRFANKSVNGEQISAEALATWKALIDKLHRVAYKTYVICENSGLKAESTDIDKTEIFAAIREILATVGEVNSHKMYANAEMAVAVIGYSGKRANKDAPELQLCNSRISNAKKEIRLAEDMSGLNPEYIPSLKERLEALEAERTELLATADMRIKQPTRTSANAFRLDVEHYFARAITGQLAKSLEELDAEEAERKAKRAAAAKARKAKKNA
jgi:hypothetical protein